MTLRLALSCSVTSIWPVNILLMRTADVRNDLLCGMDPRVKTCSFIVYTVIWRTLLFPCMLKVMPRFRFKTIYHYSIDLSALCHLHTLNVGVSAGSMRKRQPRYTGGLHVTVCHHRIRHLKLISMFLTFIRPTK